MQPSARILFNLTGNKSYYLWNGTEIYFSKLRSAYTDILNDKESDYLFFAFTILCASTLEYSLNYTLADYCIAKFGNQGYKAYFESYKGLGLKNKLLMSPFIISNGKYRMNETHSSFKKLEELIGLRNKTLHNKELLKEFDCPINGECDNENIYIPIEKTTIEFELPDHANHINLLTKDMCLSFGDAMGDFKNFIMTPSLSENISDNEMIIRMK